MSRSVRRRSGHPGPASALIALNLAGSDAAAPLAALPVCGRSETEIRRSSDDIAHEGRFATQAQGQASLAVAREVIEYLTSIAAQHAIALDT